MGRRALGRLEHSCRAIATALAGGLPRSASSCRWLWLRLAGGPNINNHGRQGLSSNSGSFWQGGVYDDAGVWALGARQQRVDYPRPLSQSSPSLSCRTSHIGPSRPSRSVWCRGASERVRRGLILSCSLLRFQQSNPAWGLVVCLLLLVYSASTFRWHGPFPGSAPWIIL